MTYSSGERPRELWALSFIYAILNDRSAVYSTRVSGLKSNLQTAFRSQMSLYQMVNLLIKRIVILSHFLKLFVSIRCTAKEKMNSIYWSSYLVFRRNGSNIYKCKICGPHLFQQSRFLWRSKLSSLLTYISV